MWSSNPKETLLWGMLYCIWSVRVAKTSLDANIRINCGPKQAPHIHKHLATGVPWSWLQSFSQPLSVTKCSVLWRLCGKIHVATYRLYSPAVCPHVSWSRLPTVLSSDSVNSPGWLLGLSIKQERFDFWVLLDEKQRQKVVTKQLVHIVSFQMESCCPILLQFRKLN